MKKDKIAIIGLGYVGLPLAVEFGKYYETIGFDLNKERISNLNNNIDLNHEMKSKQIKRSTKVKFTYSTKDISDCNIYIVCVPTPINKKKN